MKSHRFSHFQDETKTTGNMSQTIFETEVSIGGKFSMNTSIPTKFPALFLSPVSEDTAKIEKTRGFQQAKDMGSC